MLMLQDFKKFLMQGNIVDLAVAVVIGAAFGAVVTSAVNNILMPIIGIIGGEPTFDQYFFTINGSQIRWGSFLTSLVSFIIIAAAIFVALKAFEKSQQLRKQKADTDETEELSVSEELLTEIRDLLNAQRGQA